MYDYNISKLKYQQLSQKEVEKARESWKKQIKMYQLTKEGKLDLEKQIKNKLDNNLNTLKRQFITEARNGLTNNKLLIQQQREQNKNNKTREQEMLELLQFQQQVIVLQAKANTLPPEQLIQELIQVQDATLFEVFKGAILSKCDEEQAVQVRSMKYVDRELEEIESSIKDMNFLDYKQGYILPMGMDDKSLDELVFDKDMSNYFFESRGVEE